MWSVCIIIKNVCMYVVRVQQKVAKILKAVIFSGFWGLKTNSSFLTEFNKASRWGCDSESNINLMSNLLIGLRLSDIKRIKRYCGFLIKLQMAASLEGSRISFPTLEKPFAVICFFLMISKKNSKKQIVFDSTVVKLHPKCEIATLQFVIEVVFASI